MTSETTGKIIMPFEPTHTCGQLRGKDADTSVRLSGWVHRRRDHGGLIFIDLRDRYGITQLVFDPEIEKASHTKAEKLRNEFVISIEGRVKPRGEGLTNPKLSTGEIEIAVTSLSLLSTADTPPFTINEETEANEDLRLRYRYLDLRRGKIAHNMMVRHRTMLTTRNFLDKHRFLEIQTPILAKTTPEGARDYLVPSRIYPGKFYALPQSPQIFKQLLMISGLDRYFQIAPCFRDEDLRADRQPEFTQIDIEMSFATQEHLFSLTENLMQSIFKEILDINITTPFQKISHETAIDKYGTDKPDLRFDMSFFRVDTIIEQSNFSILKSVLEKDGIAKAFCIPKGALLSRRDIDELISFVTPFGLNGLAWMKKQNGTLTSNICKFFSQEQLTAIDVTCEANDDDLILIAVEKESVVNQALDHLRRHVAKKFNLIPKNRFAFTWVTDFPMFTFDPDTRALCCESHPFTSPHKDDIYRLDADPLKVRSCAYDLVLNGYEVASGSERIFDPQVQNKVFQLLKLTKEEISEKFGFFIEALKYGTPPHLGIAIGLDRLIMILCATENIREVIAFPKTQNAQDLMMQSPSEAATKQLKELHIKLSRK
jgi:aspartyl-tRNA synthetase